MANSLLGMVKKFLGDRGSEVCFYAYHIYICKMARIGSVSSRLGLVTGLGPFCISSLLLGSRGTETDIGSQGCICPVMPMFHLLKSLEVEHRVYYVNLKIMHATCFQGILMLIAAFAKNKSQK